MEMANDRKKQVEFIISFFNMNAGTRYKFSNDNNQQIVNEAIEFANGDIREIREFLKAETARGQKDLRVACQNFIDNKYIEQREAQKESESKKAEEVPVAPATDNLTASVNFLGQVVVDLLAKTKLDEIQATVGASLREDVQKFILENYGPIQRKVELQLPERKVELEGVVHSKFDDVLKFVQANEPVFLTGPAGSGKNVLCQQVAKALGLNFYFSNAVTQEYKITGFTDAMGVFHESQFFKAFKNGGLFMLDEMDASIPEVLIILNAAIANRYFDFPAPIGYVEAHPDFRVIAAGNTFGNGADYDYVGRNQLDAASLDRFAQVRVDYDPRIEEACANGDADLLRFCRKFRAATKKAGIRTVVSYRAISRLAKLSQSMDVADLLESCLIKSLELDDLKAIEKELDGCGRYTGGFRTIIANRASN